MILYATFVLYYITNTVERKTINKLNNNTTKAEAYQANQQGKASSRNGKTN